MASTSDAEALACQKELGPLAQKLFSKNEDYQRLVAAYYLRYKCYKNICIIGERVGRLNNQQAQFLVYRQTGYYNFKNECYPWPLNDEMYANMYYMQRAYLTIYGLTKKLLQSSDVALYKRILELEYKLEDYNAEHWYKAHKMNDNGALFVNTIYSDYDTSINTLMNAIHAFDHPETKRYMYVANTDKKARELAALHKKDVNEFCAWNKFKGPDVTIPAGYVYFGGFKNY